MQQAHMFFRGPLMWHMFLPRLPWGLMPPCPMLTCRVAPVLCLLRNRMMVLQMLPWWVALAAQEATPACRWLLPAARTMQNGRGLRTRSVLPARMHQNPCLRCSVAWIVRVIRRNLGLTALASIAAAVVIGAFAQLARRKLRGMLVHNLVLSSCQTAFGTGGHFSAGWMHSCRGLRSGLGYLPSCGRNVCGGVQ